MGTSPIKEIGFPFAQIAGPEAAGPTQGQDDMFSKVMTEAAAKSGQTLSGPGNSGAVTGTAGAVRVNKTGGEAKNIDRDVDRRDDLNKTVKDDLKETGREVAKKADEIKDAIKEELDITDEQLEEAMAVMGFTPVDLLNTDNVKGLMLELSGQSDPLALITNEELHIAVSNVLDLTQDLLAELSEEFGITEDMLAAMAGESLAMQEALTEETGMSDMSDTTEQADNFAVQPLSVDKEDDTEEPGDQGIRVEVRRDDELVKEPEIRNTSPENASMQKKVNDIMDGRRQDNPMQGSLAGGEPSPAPIVAEAVPEATGTTSYVDTENILRQITDYMKVNMGTDTTSMELQLHPASLGTVNLQVASNGGVVTANILVQNEAVKAVIEGQMVQLLETFREQGQQVEAIEVAVAGYDLDRSPGGNNEGNSGEKREGGPQGVRAASRRRLNLSELTEEDMEELTQEEQLAAEMMTANGTSVDFQA